VGGSPQIAEAPSAPTVSDGVGKRAVPGSSNAQPELGRSDENGPAGSFAGLAGSWRALEASGVSPTQHFIWAEVCADTLHDAPDLRPLVVERDGAATAIAPLALGPGPLKRLEAVGVRTLCEPMDFIYSNDDALTALVDRLARQPIPIQIDRVRADSPLVGAIKQAFQGRGLVHVSATSPCPYIDLDASWREPEKHFNSGRRSDFRRARRHADQLGAVTFEVRSPAPHEVSALLDEALAVEAQSWKGAAGSALARDPLRAGFFRRYAAAASARGILRLLFMRINGAAVGMQFAIESDRRFWLFKIGYDERVARCCPGTLLMLHAVKYAAEQGLDSVEFLGSVDPWTSTWTKTLRECQKVQAYPFSLQGAAALGWDGGRWALRRIRKNLASKSA
jgi:CelD/BcsL family acetyltransferase involved in cellulose biosynthesis